MSGRTTADLEAELRAVDDVIGLLDIDDTPRDGDDLRERRELDERHRALFFAIQDRMMGRFR